MPIVILFVFRTIAGGRTRAKKTQTQTQTRSQALSRTQTRGDVISFGAVSICLILHGGSCDAACGLREAIGIMTVIGLDRGRFLVANV